MSLAVSMNRVMPRRQHAWWLLIVMHVTFMAFTIAQGGLRLALPNAPEHVAVAVPLSVLAGLLQLRHSLAAASGVRPRHWRWTLVALVVIAYAPLSFMGSQWITLQWFVLASVAMLLPMRVALAAVVVSAIIDGYWFTILDNDPAAPLSSLVWTFMYWEALQFLGAGGLYGATRLVRLADELREARTELADLAIGRERLRISRDLHDLLGQSLSAVSLKGDLAIGLLARQETPRALAEIESLVSVARSALHDVRDVAHREPPITLAAEVERASELLASIGTDTRVTIADETLAPQIDELFAWALREGVTNVLRHSSATTCTIAITRRDDGVRLEITNDGAMPASRGGSGLSGLAARASALGGSAMGELLGDDQFRLCVEVPDLAAMGVPA
jgi:two-component system sensor histidine kinase DesK